MAFYALASEGTQRHSHPFCWSPESGPKALEEHGDWEMWLWPS